MKPTQLFKTSLVATLLAIILLVAQPLQAGVYVELVDTLEEVYDYIPSGQPVIFNVKLANDAGENIEALQHGFRVYSPTGVTWEPITFSTASSVGDYFDFVSATGFGITGSGADTVGFIAIAGTKPGFPNGYDDVVLRIETQVTSMSNLDTLCIDSSFYQPSGSWTWTTPSGLITPAWGGPYCYKIYHSTNTSISGRKFRDYDHDSRWDNWEPPLENIKIKLHGDLVGGTTVSMTDFTNAQGEYSFINLYPGDYYIQEDLTTGWDGIQTYPPTVYHTIKNLQANDNLTGYDFGNDSLCEISTSIVTCIHGTDDSFNGPEPTNMSTGLNDYIVTTIPLGATIGEFDEVADDTWFGHTFDGCFDHDCLVVDATLRIKVRAETGSPNTDVLILGDYSGGNNGRIWARRLREIDADQGGDGVWTAGEIMIIELELDNLNKNTLQWQPTNILGALQDGNLDIIISDETTVDYIELEVELCCDCEADGDANGDGLGLSLADIIYLVHFLDGTGSAPDPLHSCDLNGDGYISVTDVMIFQACYINGTIVLNQYGGYPVPVPCDPIVTFISPDYITIFGLDHASLGTACYTDTGDVLTVGCINMVETEVHTDANGDSIIVQSAPVAKIAGSGGGPFGSSMSNLEDAGIVWEVDFAEDTTLESGASIETFAYVEITEDSIVVECSAVQTKQEDDTWALGINSYASTHTIIIWLEDSVVYRQEGISAVGDWFQPGNIGPLPAKAAGSGGGPFGSSMSNLEDAGIVVVAWEEPDTVVWNCASLGVTDVECTRIQVSFDRTGERMTVASIGAYNIPEYTIVSESQTVDYKGVGVSNLGHAILDCVDTALVVSNLGPSGDDGIAPWLRDEDKSYVEIVIENPDLGGSFPVGGSVRVGYEFASSTGDETFPMESFFDFAGSNTWNLGVQSDTDSYTVIAFDDDDTVFHASGVDASSLGYIVENAKGVYPVGFSGSTNGKPSTFVATADYDFTASPDGVQWSWSAQSVSNLTIDYLSVAPEVDNYDDGVCSMSLCGQDGSKAGPISLTILDIMTQYKGCCIGLRGNADNDPLDQVLVNDLVFLVNYVFKGGTAPVCLEEADVNGDGNIFVNDLTLLVNYIFKGGAAPLACGVSAPFKAGKIVNSNIEISADYSNGKTTVSLVSPVDMKGIQIELTGEDNSNVVSHVDGMTLFFYQKENSSRVGILDLEGNNVINSGQQRLFELDGEFEISSAIISDLNHNAITPVITTAGKLDALPEQFRLDQNYPNPFNPTTTIVFSIPQDSKVTLDVFNIMGQRVKGLVDEELSAGEHSIEWDSRNSSGRLVSSGIYFYKLQTDNKTDSKKMMLLK